MGRINAWGHDFGDEPVKVNKGHPYDNKEYIYRYVYDNDEINKLKRQIRELKKKLSKKNKKKSKKKKK